MNRLKQFWDAIRPSYHARRGAVLAALLTALWAVTAGALNLHSGFGLGVDALFSALAALLCLGTTILAVALALSLIKPLPRVLTGIFAGCALVVSLLWLEVYGLIFACLLLFVECALGATLATILRGGLTNAPLAKRVATWSILALALAGNVGFLSLLHSEGTMNDLVQMPSQAPADAKLEDPSKPGSYEVKRLNYGSGASLRRPEFGPSVAIRTKPVDASRFFKEFTGWKAWLRKRYWGFGMDKLPLNAQVFYPAGPGPFPLFLLVHGNHEMSEPSDSGYAYLCELLASRGYIAVSVDENFLDSGLFHDPPKQQPVRGWMLLEHLRLWHQWNADSGSPFFKKVDITRIAVAGHSRGGEAAATAALFNLLPYYPDDATIPFHYGYQIKSVVAIAPADGQYKPAEQWRFLKDINYLTLQGSNDSDLSSFLGSRQYDHVHFSGAVRAFKSELYIYRANHGQFNTVWGRTDQQAPLSWFLNLAPLLPSADQRQIAKVYISAFLDATLRGREEYQAIFRNYRDGLTWLPKTIYLNRFEDQSYRPICSFDEDADVSTATMPGGRISTSGLTVWREGKIPYRDGSREYNGVFIGWNWAAAKKAPVPAPSYTIDFPPMENSGVVNLSVAVTDDDAPPPGKRRGKEQEPSEIDDSTGFGIEATNAKGLVARVDSTAFAVLPPPLRTQFTKLQWLDTQIYKSSSEPVFQSVRIPLNAFAKSNPSFPQAPICRLRLIFDKNATRVLIISGIGFEQSPPGA